MTRIKDILLFVLSTFTIPLLGAYLLMYFSRLQGILLVLAVTAIAIVLSILGRALFAPGILYFSRGVVGVGRDRKRQAQFSRPWASVRNEIRVWGIGMTNLSRDERIIREAVEKRKVNVIIELPDVVWLHERKDICRQIDETYGRQNFIDQIADSTELLVALAQELNHKHGADRVQIVAVASFSPQSGTFADVDLEKGRGWGWVEFHTKGFPIGQPRLKLQNYKPTNKLDEPLLASLIYSRNAMKRRRIDNI